MPIQVARPSALEKYVSRRVADLIAVNHYAKHPVDREYSARWFSEYFRQLDPNRLFFMQSDIEDFRSYEPILGDLVLRRGSVDFASDVYERYLQRVREWVLFANGLLEQPMDFSADESILADRRQEPWPPDREALQDLWRRHLKNRLLLEHLQDERAQRASADAATSGDHGAKQKQGDDPDAGVAELVDPDGVVTASGGADRALTPEARVAQSHKRFLKRKLEAESFEIIETFLSSLTRIYDPHSLYMAPETQEDFDISMSLSLQGIGAVLTTKDSYVEIVEIVPGGPAGRDGRLKPGDRIIAVAQGDAPETAVDVVDMNLRKVVRLIRGPKGTTVHLTVLEAGSSLPVPVALVRDKVELTEQEAKSDLRDLPLPDAVPGSARVAVIELPSFYCDFGAKRDGQADYRSCTRDVRRLLEQATGEPLDGVVLDLRANGGGALDEAVQLAGLFSGNAPVVQIRDHRGKVQRRDSPEEAPVYTGPLVVLVDRFSASASEIVAAALQDHRRAVIVGEACTHGKGTVQTVYSLDRLLERTNLFEGQQGGSLKFTIQKFYRVNGGSTQVKGVVPDIVFRSFTDHMEIGEAHLPNALPWDEIAPVAAGAGSGVDVGPILDELRARSQGRRAASQAFAALEEDIDRYAVRRQQQTLTLCLDQRRSLQVEDEQWSVRMRELARSKRRRAAGETEAAAGAPKDEPREDLVLDEALHILADLIVLQRGDGAGPAAGVAVEAGGDAGALPPTPGAVLR